ALLTATPVAATRCAVCLLSSSSTLAGLNFGCSLLGAGLASALASTFFSVLASGFFCSDFCSTFFGSAFAKSLLIASAIRSGCGSDFFLSGFGGVGSVDCTSVAACTSVLAGAAVASSTGLGSPTLSTSGAAALGAVLEPAVS